MAIQRCKYCLAPLAEDGFCSRPCKMGTLKRKKAELEKQKGENSDNGNSNIINNSTVADATKAN